MAFASILFWFVIVVAAKGSPTKVLQDQVDTLNCIPTKWGCIDISDPSFRPRLNVEQPSATNLKAPCIPSPWGCIDPSDPSIRPRSMPDEDGTSKPIIANPPPCHCIPTPYGCIDPCDPGFHPKLNE
ncbi:unnamed protein product [Ceutorhynchus assimilis]|uniref:Uncharacterized protein n=1 Tax=Ceutorhynchus assimilis TaxID=467358 RepID=A0A9N9MF24_9CUCU|nr:unnamed protein product [Ceutorhynchus assimilis]